MKTIYVNNHAHSSILSLHHRLIESLVYFVKRLWLLLSLSQWASQSLADYKNGQTIKKKRENQETRNVVIVIIFLLLSSFCNRLFAQSNFIFRHYDTNSGLSNPNVNDIFQDSRDAIWIATNNGVNLFDGYEFKSYYHNVNDTNSLSGNLVNSICEDKQGNLWFGTFGHGVSRYDIADEKFTLFDLTGNALVYKILCDINGTIWIASSTGLYSIKGNRLIRETEKLTHDLGQDRNGTLWMSTDEGLFYRLNNENIFRPINQLKGKTIVRLFIEQSGREVYFFELNELKKLKKVNSEWEILSTGISNDWFRDNEVYFPILKDSKQRLWAGTHTSAVILNSISGKKEVLKHSVTNPYGILPGKVNVFKEDKNGNIWIGTQTGISLLTQGTNRFTNTYPEFIKQIKFARAILKDGQILWYSTNKGLFCWNIAQISPKLVLLNVPINKLLKSKDGFIYAGSASKEKQGFYKIHAQSLKTQFFGDEAVGNRNFWGGAIWSLAEDRNGRIWVGAWDNLQCFDPQTELFIHFRNTWNKLCDNSGFLDLLTDVRDDLWIATMNCGLYRLEQPYTIKKEEDAKFSNFKYDSRNNTSISSNTVQSLYQNTDRILWIGTSNGLNRFDDAKRCFRRYLLNDGLPEENILSLTGDKQGRLWIGTGAHGIVCFDEETRKFTRFGSKDGLSTESFPLNGVYKDAKDMLLWRTELGLQIFHPDSVFSIQTYPPPLLFTELSLDNKIISSLDSSNVLSKNILSADTIQLSPRYKTLSIQFAALDYNNTSNINYAIWVEGFHETWQDLGNDRKTTLTNLWPWTYKLHVKATNTTNGYTVYSKPLVIIVLTPWYLSFWAILGYLFIIGVVLYTFYRFQLNRKLAAAETLRIKELNAVKTRLYTNITHEFRTPLTIIIGMADQVMTNPKEWYHDGIRLILRNGKQLLSLVNQMMDLSKLESGAMSIHWQQGNIIPYMRYLQESFHSLAANKHIDLQFYTDKEKYYMDYDSEKMQNIVANLISNAIKYTPEGGTVILSLNTVTQSVMAQDALKGGDFTFSVSDTGIGIPADKLPHVFDRFYQVDDSNTRKAEGTGIGLTLTKELIQLMGGTIHVKSVLGQGSEFTVRLPVTQKAKIMQSEPLEYIESDNRQPLNWVAEVQKPLVLTEKEAKTKPLVLLVEDNQDVVQYLHICLKDDYRIVSAANGAEGWTKTLDLIPDLVISDVMMPIMDGLELCQKLKTHIQTSHIPIVLLTAKGDMDSKVAGLELGADDYLAKPFEKRELKARLKNLLSLRNALQERYRTTILLNETQNIIEIKPTLDDIFIKDLKAFIEAHLDDIDLDVHSLEKQFIMSRTTLHRKLVALTDMSATAFIRFVRLTKASEILRGEKDKTISEVAYTVGFASLSHFTRSFHELFGVTPTTWREGKNEG